MDLHKESVLEKMNNKTYRKTYITEARQEFLDEALDQYLYLSNVMVKDSEGDVEKAYISWLEHYDRIKLLKELNDIHELNKNMDF